MHQTRTSPGRAQRDHMDALAGILVLFLMMFSPALWAWPADSDWIPVYQNGLPVTDPEGDVSQSMDIVGDASYPAAYIHNNGSHLHFRFRLDETPDKNGGLDPFGWGFLVDTDMNADDYEYMIMVDGINNPDLFYLAKNTVKTAIGDPSDKAEVVVWSEHANRDPISGNYRITTADSNFHADPDYFLEFRIPYDLFKAELGLTDTSLIRYFVGSSASAQTLSKDLLGTDLYGGLSEFVLPIGTLPTTGSVKFVGDIAGNGDVTYFYVTDTLFVRVDDSDQNGNASAVDTVSATLTNPSGDSETITLYETGIDTGIFTGSINTTGGSAIVGDGTLQITLIEIVTVTYIDGVDASLVENQTRTDTIEALPLADLAVAKTASNATPNEGDTIKYTVMVTNTGPSTSLSAQVTDVLPSGVSYSSYSASTGSYNPGSGIWTFGTLAIGASATLTIDATVDAGTAQQVITNSASITSTGQLDDNNANDSASVSIGVQGADVAVTKAVDDDAPSTGDTVTFTIGVTNNGSNAATNVVITDLLPSGLSYLSDSGTGAYNSGTGEWSISTLANGASASLDISASVTAAAGSTITNTASVTHADQGDPDGSNNSASADLYVGATDLAVTKSVDTATADEGDTVQYTIQVTNAGPNPATSVVVDDQLPSGVTYVSHSGGTYDSGTGLWSIGNLAVGASASLTITATVDAHTAGQTITNTASVNSGQLDQNSANDTGTADFTVNYADLSITKVVDNPSPNNGDAIVFTVTLTNNGIATAYNIQATDYFPKQLTLDSYSASSGTYNSSTGRWTVPSLAVGASATLTMNATVSLKNNDSTSFFNTINIDQADQADPVPGNNSASAAVKVSGLDIGLTKSVDTAMPAAGGSVTFTIVATNNGPNDATSLVVSDKLPTGISYSSYTSSQGGYNGGSGQWTVGSLAVGASATLTVTGITGAGTDGEIITNYTNVASVDQADVNAYNDSASASIYVGGSDLALSKTIDTATPTEGDTVTYTLTVGNLGPNDVTGVEVTDILPFGLTYVSAAGTGSYDSVTGIWSAGAVTNGSSVSIDISATVDSGTGGSTITNTGTITASSGLDAVAGNNSASVDLTVQRVDLVMSKLVSDSTPTEGDHIIYTLTANNLGPHTATNVTVTDHLPSGVTFVSANTATGSYDSGAGIWTIGTMAKSASAVLNITVSTDTVGSDTLITNTATIDGDQADSNTGNNTSGVDITVLNYSQPLLTILKSADKSGSGASPGEAITYSVIITNTGDDIGTVVVVRDQLSPYTALTLDPFGNGTPFNFNAGTSGLTIGSHSYSNDDGTTWAYIPVDDGSGHDGNITDWRIDLNGSMAVSGQFTLTYRTVVK